MRSRPVVRELFQSYYGRSRKSVRTELERTRRASLADEEIHRQRAVEMDSGASSSISTTGERSTTDGAEMDVGTTEGDPSTAVAGYRKSDPPTCGGIFGAMRLRFALPTTMCVCFFYIGNNVMLFLLGMG